MDDKLRLKFKRTEKTCSRCKKTKPVSDFSPKKSCYSGYNDKCKPCASSYISEKMAHKKRKSKWDL